eukprot:gene5837-6121_t
MARDDRFKMARSHPHTTSQVPTRPRSNSCLPAPGPAWISTVGEYAMDIIPHSNINYITDALWGLASLGYKPKPAAMDIVITASMLNQHTIQREQLVRFLMALGTIGYVPSTPQAKDMFCQWCLTTSKIAGRRNLGNHEVCDMVWAISCMPYRPAPIVHEQFISSMLRDTRISYQPDFGFLHSYCQAIDYQPDFSILHSYCQAIGYQPDFGFLHSYCQAVRISLNSFAPNELADMLEAVAAFQCYIAADPLWVSEVMASVLCKMESFDASAIAGLLRGATQLPGLQPSAQWLAATIYRVEEILPTFSGPQMGDIIMALAKIGYRPPANVLDGFVHHLSINIHELPVASTNAIAEALTVIVPNYLGLGDGHEEYQALQMKLRVHQIPAAVLLQPVPNAKQISSRSSPTSLPKAPQSPPSGSAPLKNGSLSKK